MAQGFSKENQSTVETAYRFGEFELHPANRLLRQNGKSVALQPKAFDALLCLVRRAEHLVCKEELKEMLWPTVHVSEANLTNTIVSLRKIVGRDAIRTVSKHGYRFEMRVECEPGVARVTYERFARAKELTAQRSVESMTLARDLYWTCLAEDPNFAAAWAWMGRCCWFQGKFGGNAERMRELTEAAFERALAIDAELASAHQFYTLVQVDTGHAGAAMERLIKRLERHPNEPECFAGLVQVLRFRGLLKESERAHRRAVELDPAMVTSVAHTRFAAGEYAAAIEIYGGRGAYYLDVAAWAALGELDRAVALLRERLERMALSELMSALLGSLLAVLEGKHRKAVRLMEEADAMYEPEIVMYFARHYGRMGMAERAVECLRAAMKAGFVCAPEMLREDAWLGAVRESAEFGALMKEAETRVQAARVGMEDSPAIFRIA
jgi:DNA-binding winged helix-turn-helix (wHTH) protein